MAYATALHTMNAMRGSTARLAAEASNAGFIIALSKALTAAGCATATTTSKAKTVNALTYTIRGQFYTKAATDNLWTPAGVVVPVSSFQKYLLLLDTLGNASVQEGAVAATAAAVGWANVSGLSRYAPLITALGDTKCCVGTLTVATNASTTYTPGTTLLGAAGITATYIDGMDQSIVPFIADSIGNIVGNGG